jgi:hypothetical protein
MCKCFRSPLHRVMLYICQRENHPHIDATLEQPCARLGLLVLPGASCWFSSPVRGRRWRPRTRARSRPETGGFPDYPRPPSWSSILCRQKIGFNLHLHGYGQKTRVKSKIRPCCAKDWPSLSMRAATSSYFLKEADGKRMDSMPIEKPRGSDTPGLCSSARLIPSPIDQNRCAHWRNPMDMIRQG